MIKSDIFDSFVKIAQEKGLVSDDSFKKLEKNPRADSLDISAIEALYGTKPNTHKSMEYKKNIMEVAHPNSVIVSPSYDKLNGLVENEIERQNINLHIVQKNPDGLSTKRKYAQTDLLLSLVKIGNDLDDDDKDELRKLSDVCLLQINEESNKGFKKEAIIPIIIGAALVLGAIYVYQHLPDLDEGLENNYRRLVSELNDFLDSNTNWGVGHSYDADIKSDVQGLLDRLNSFNQVYQSINGTIRQLERPKDAKELMLISQQPQTQEITDAVKKLRDLITNISAYMDAIQKDFSSTSYKARHTTDEGIFTSILEKTQVSKLWADDFQDVVNAIPPFQSSVKDLLTMLQNSKSIEDKAHSDLIASQTKSNSEFGGATTDFNAQTSPKPAQSVADLDQQAHELSNMLSGQNIG